MFACVTMCYSLRFKASIGLSQLVCVAFFTIIAAVFVHIFLTSSVNKCVIDNGKIETYFTFKKSNKQSASKIEPRSTKAYNEIRHTIKRVQ